MHLNGEKSLKKFKSLVKKKHRHFHFYATNYAKVYFTHFKISHQDLRRVACEKLKWLILRG